MENRDIKEKASAAWAAFDEATLSLGTEYSAARDAVCKLLDLQREAAARTTYVFITDDYGVWDASDPERAARKIVRMRIENEAYSGYEADDARQAIEDARAYEFLQARQNRKGHEIRRMIVQR